MGHPDLDKYFKEKYGENYEKDAEIQYEDRSSRANLGQLFANIGDAVGGKQIGSQNAYFDSVDKRNRADTVGKLEAERKAKMESMSFGADMDKSKRESALSDPNSQESINMRMAIEKTAPKLREMYGDKWNMVTAADQDRIFSPYKFQQDTETQRTAARLASDDKKIRQEELRAERQKKDAELSSTQAKQQGLHNMGSLAATQYDEATADKTKYDPTASFQMINNAPDWIPGMKNLKDPEAVKAQASQSAWVEAFLRDASGAAIPPSERGDYAVDYFPQPGDTPDVVKNKAALRKQKQENALIGAGPQGKPMEKPPTYPKTLFNGLRRAKVSNPQEEAEAKAEGFQ